MKPKKQNSPKGGWGLTQISRFLKTNDESYAETLLGDHLTRRFSVRFDRFIPVSSFIADFYCEKEKLIIELESKAQILPEEVLYSEERDKELAAEGIKILKFSNYEIFHDLKSVLSRIESELKKGSKNESLLPSKIYS